MATMTGFAIAALALQTLDGLPFDLANWSDRTATVVVFISGRCETSRDTIGEISRAYEKHRMSKIMFVGVCANDSEPADELRAFCQGRGVRFPVYRDPGGQAAKRLGISVTPEAVVVDSKGNVVAHGGFATPEARDHIAAAIAAVAAGKPIDQPSMPATGTPIASPGQPLEHDDLFGHLAFSSELIFEQIPGAPAHHCSTITQAPNGDLLAVWYGGSYESADDQVLFMSRRAAGSRNWTAPEVIVRGDALHPPGNALIFAFPSGRIGLLWGRMDAPRPIRRGAGWGQCELMFRSSDDNGVTWTDDRPIDGHFGSLPRNVPITLADGRLAVPIAGRGGHAGSYLLITADNSDSWTDSATVPKGGSQPTVIQRDDGSLLALMRSEPAILQSESADLGATWTPAVRTPLKCPDAGIAMVRLKSGSLLLVHNDSTFSRTPLVVERSTDAGATWKRAASLETDPGEYSYPCIIQTADGRIHVTYTCRRYSIKHVEFNEDWLTRYERPN